MIYKIFFCLLLSASIHLLSDEKEDAIRRQVVNLWHKIGTQEFYDHVHPHPLCLWGTFYRVPFFSPEGVEDFAKNWSHILLTREADIVVETYPNNPLFRYDAYYYASDKFKDEPSHHRYWYKSTFDIPNDGVPVWVGNYRVEQRD